MPHTVINNPKLTIPEDIKPSYEHSIYAFEHDELTHGANRELLTDSIISLRLSIRHRLLILRFKYLGQTYYFPLELVLEHNYRDSLAKKKPGEFKKYIEKLEPFLREEISRLRNGDKVSSETPSDSPDKKESIDFGPTSNLNVIDLSIFDNTLVKLNQAQEKALYPRFPQVISGYPGSGKTMLLIFLLNDFEMMYAENDKPSFEEEEKKEEDELPASLKPILYVTHSQRLVYTANQLKANTPGGVKGYSACLSYYDLLRHLPETEGYRILNDIDKEEQWEDEPNEETDETLEQSTDDYHIQPWLKRYIKQENKRLKVQKKRDETFDFFNNPLRIEQEFRLLSRLIDAPFETYAAIGTGNTLFQDHEQKKWIYNALKSYLGYLQQEKVIHPAFYRVKARNLFTQLLVDEGQDFTYLQLWNLFQLCKNKAMVVMIDAYQALNDPLSILPHLIELVGGKSHFTTLPTTHRCSQQVIRAANTLLEMRRQVFQGNPDKYSPSEIPILPNQTKPGSFYWFKDINPLTKMDDIYDNPDVAVILNEPTELDLSSICSERQIYNDVSLIKGLEFNIIIFINPLGNNSKLIKTINEPLQSQVKATTNRCKHKELEMGESQIRLIFNRFFTGVTRGRDMVCVVQEEFSHAIEVFARNFIARSQCQVTFKSGATPNSPLVSPEEKKQNWHKVIKALKRQGQHKKAFAIEQSLDNEHQSDLVQKPTSPTTATRARLKSTQATSLVSPKKQRPNRVISSQASSLSDGFYEKKFKSQCRYAFNRSQFKELFRLNMHRMFKNYTLRRYLVEHALQSAKTAPEIFKDFIAHLDVFIKNYSKKEPALATGYLIILGITITHHLANKDPGFYKPLLDKHLYKVLDDLLTNIVEPALKDYAHLDQDLYYKNQVIASCIGREFQSARVMAFTDINTPSERLKKEKPLEKRTAYANLTTFLKHQYYFFCCCSRRRVKNPPEYQVAKKLKAFWDGNHRLYFSDHDYVVLTSNNELFRKVTLLLESAYGYPIQYILMNGIGLKSSLNQPEVNPTPLPIDEMMKLDIDIDAQFDYEQLCIAHLTDRANNSPSV